MASGNSVEFKRGGQCTVVTSGLTRLLVASGLGKFISTLDNEITVAPESEGSSSSADLLREAERLKDERVANGNQCPN